MKLSSAKRGFTLIELLVVIAIIGILSSVVLASLGTARTKARDATRISDLKNIQLALELYFDSNQSYPFEAAAAPYIPPSAALTTAPNIYIPRIPAGPLSGETYFYRASTVGDGTYTACTAGSCIAFMLGADLERADNSVLTSDVDRTWGTFVGTDSQDCQGAATTRYCYDLTN